MKEKAFPILYILMRNDLDSLNPGKAVAQGSHATSMFHKEIESVNTEKDWSELYQLWCEDRAFGTVLTLDVDERQLRGVVEMASTLPHALADMVLDPTYPIRDGKVTHYLPLVTCGYVFGDKDYLAALLRHYGLMP